MVDIERIRESINGLQGPVLPNKPNWEQAKYEDLKALANSVQRVLRVILEELEKANDSKD